LNSFDYTGQGCGFDKLDLVFMYILQLLYVCMSEQAV
jgi:hypothetical protein